MMILKEKWLAQIEILEKLKKTLEKKLEGYQKEGDSFVAQNIDDFRKGKESELKSVIEHIEDEIDDIQDMGINNLRDC